MNPSDVTIRPMAGAEELDLFGRLRYVLDHELADDFAQRRRRPEWTWVALDGDRLVARLAFWGRADADRPALLDFFDLDAALSRDDRLTVGGRLLDAALAAVVPKGTRPPEYSRFVPPDWRDDDAARSAVEDRIAIAEQAGARLLTERLRLEWRPGAAITEPSGRLTFRQFADTEELLALTTSALAGTLDAHSRDDLTRMSARDAAVQHYEDEFARFSSPRAWWRVAVRGDGEPVGFVIPARNAYNPIIAYLAVLPAHRGNGYIDEILAEGTRILAGEDVPRIRASTDLANVPMARAFHRAGYVNFEREIKMTWSD
ncbi:GNAT family N-acetyltransferase [Streptacidiphilus fuscans]|uniref:GNAT family N-acetyltransferase n=1 Tax=Streptacidiphilus fuscans TaxID=2789292 RepID=A0A931FAT1_9ACTN|nr:GNAT family N-acetyltransferase [Streptacidiphilus fuscans]MBF9066723.1 GNAT family N-acetyltransferase [Streptacidiphilus fuscans]